MNSAHDGKIELVPIGFVRSSRTEATDDCWDREKSFIELTDRFSPESLQGLGDFSHGEIIFFMDQVEEDKIETGARHPRKNPAWPKVGIFSQRGKSRPNKIGATVCRIDKVDGCKIFVTGLDAIDGTPVLDIKPWMKEFGPRTEVTQPSWATEIMKNYWSKKWISTS